ncbi:MAG: LuxR C-terminal-related transcriptional regulator [Fibrobacterales bacterium]
MVPVVTDTFTVRQKEILHLLAQGFNNSEIAQQLSISPNTVKAHLQKIYEYFGVSNRTEASHYYSRSLVGTVNSVAVHSKPSQQAQTLNLYFPNTAMEHGVARTVLRALFIDLQHLRQDTMIQLTKKCALPVKHYWLTPEIIDDSILSLTLHYSSGEQAVWKKCINLLSVNGDTVSQVSQELKAIMDCDVDINALVK